MSRDEPKRRFAVEVVERLTKAGYQALWAGGCVRDVLLGRDPIDYDVATDARPDQVRELFGQRKTIAVGASFGVIIVIGPKGAGNVEVATFRVEGPYADGRRPDHVTFSSPEEDAQRRDFTINGMFYDPIAGRVLDFVGGEQDLSCGVVRAIGNARARMSEDKLRMLRAVRFTANLEFELDTSTADAIREMAADIQVVSAERIAQELRRILVDKHRARAIELARQVGLLPVILPELVELPGETSDADGTLRWQKTLRMLTHLQAPSFELAAAALLYEAAASHGDLALIVGNRLRLSNIETERIGWLLKHRHGISNAPRLTLAQLKRLLAHTQRDDLLALERVALLASASDLSPVVFCEEFLRRTPHDVLNPPPLITGDDLVQMGLRPGKRFRELLEAARDAQLNDEIDSKEKARRFVRQMTSNQHE